MNKALFSLGLTLVIIGIILSLPRNTINYSLNTLIAGDPLKSCNSDLDCRIKPVSCNPCDCGDAVNIKWERFCPLFNDSDYLCDICIIKVAKCVDKQCQAVV